MPDLSGVKEIFRLSFDKDKPSLTIETDWIVVIVIVGILLLLFFMRRPFLRKLRWHEMEIEISGSPKAVFKVERNEENLYIANRIYIELTTRKAAIPIDETNDVIEEVYDSWYNMFGIIRDELKALPGKYLKNHDATSALIGISRKILNEALRPHLTEHQARFRKWFENAKEAPENSNKSPQEIQQSYPDFQNLVTSMKNVNLTLIRYAEELDTLIKGK
jgi:hypothetical protein